jgi:hypothetical protein
MAETRRISGHQGALTEGGMDLLAALAVAWLRPMDTAVALVRA